MTLFKLDSFCYVYICFFIVLVTGLSCTYMWDIHVHVCIWGRGKTSTLHHTFMYMYVHVHVHVYFLIGKTISIHCTMCCVYIQCTLCVYTQVYTLKSFPSISFPSSVCSSFSNGLRRPASMPYSAGAPLMDVSTLHTGRNGEWGKLLVTYMCTWTMDNRVLYYPYMNSICTIMLCIYICVCTYVYTCYSQRGYVNTTTFNFYTFPQKL